MPTHLLLEGADIESVLTRLREDHGPDAKIIQAELVRVGGIGGFFAKRRYEVTVEVDDSEPSTPVHVDPAAPPLADRAPAPQPDRALAAASGMDALLSAAEDRDQAEVGGLRVDSPAPVTTPPIQLPAQGWHRPVSTQGEAFSDVLGSLTLGLVDPSTETAAPEVPGDASAEPVSGFRSFAPPAIWAAAAGRTIEPRPSARRTEPGPSVERTRGRLAALGVPERLLAEVTSGDLVLAMRDIVAALPEPGLPTWQPSATRGGALVVVVGSWEQARTTVTGLVHEIGADPAAVLAVATVTGTELAEGHTVRSYGAAVELVQRARQEYDVSVLVIDPGPTRHSAARAADTVRILEPQSVLVTADATTDLGPTLLALDALDQAGVPADAMALTGVARAIRPAAALEIPVPVSWLDGRVATTGSWLGLLVDAGGPRAGRERGVHVPAHAKAGGC